MGDTIKKLCKPTFKRYGRGAGIPILKTIWDFFDLFHLLILNITLSNRTPLYYYHWKFNQF